MSRGWTPRAFGSDLKQWLDPRRLALADNDAIASSTDWSGQGNHATQSTTAAKPTYKTNAINGRSAELYSTDDFLIADGVGSIASGDDRPFSVFGVARITDTTAGRMLFSFGGAAATQFHTFSSSGDTQLVAQRRDDAGTVVTQSPVVTSVSAAFVFAHVFNGTTVNVWYNLTQSAALSLDSGVATFNSFTWGARRRAGTTLDAFLAGYLGARFVLGRAATDAEATRSIRYLARLYGVTV